MDGLNTDLSNNSFAWTAVVYTRFDNVAQLAFQDAGGGSHNFNAGAPGLGLVDGWAAIVSSYGLRVVDTTSVPDGGATVTLLGSVLLGLGVLSRKLRSL